MGRSRFTIDFSDLFDWELESDRHLYNMVCGPYAGEEIPHEKQEAKIVLKHKRKSDGDNNTKAYKRSLPGTNQEGV